MSSIQTRPDSARAIPYSYPSRQSHPQGDSANLGFLREFFEGLGRASLRTPTFVEAKQLMTAIDSSNSISVAIQAIRRANIILNAFHYSALLQKSDSVDELRLVMSSIPLGVINNVHFSIVIKKASILRDYDFAKEIYGNMPKHFKTAATYSTAIKAAVDGQGYEFARQVYQEMPLQLKTEIIYSTMIKAAAENQDYAFAKQVYEGIPEHLRDAVIYNTMIKAAGDNQNYEFAKQIYQGMSPSLKTVVTYSTILKAAGASQDYKFAKQVYQEMPDRFKTDVSYGTMIKTAAENQDYEFAKQVYQEMPKHLRNALIYNIMIKAAGASQDYKFAKQVYQETPELLRDPAVYNQLIDCMVKAGWIEDAQDYMHESGFYARNLIDVSEQNDFEIDLHYYSHGAGYMLVREFIHIARSKSTTLCVIVGQGSKEDGNYLAFRRDLIKYVKKYHPDVKCAHCPGNAGRLILSW